MEASSWDHSHWREQCAEERLCLANTRNMSRQDKVATGFDAGVAALHLNRWEKKGFSYTSTWVGGSDLKPCTDAGFLYNPYGAPSGTDRVAS